MEQLPPTDRPESPDERKQRRRVRRWKRRARMVGPFLGVTAVLVTLALSVDLIEYQPQPPKERLTDRPIPEAVRARNLPGPAATPAGLSGASVLGRDTLGTSALIVEDAIDVSLAAEAALTGERPAPSPLRIPEVATPTPPAALRGGR